MLAWLKQGRDRHRNARRLYGSIVTQARSRGFYADWGVPDTVEGRFEMIALHLVVVLHRLGTVGETDSKLGQALTEVFVADIDDSLREMTVGDLAVPRQVKRAVAVLRDRYDTYGTAFAATSDAPLTAAVETRLSGLPGAEGLDAGRICAYIREANRALDPLSDAEVIAGHVGWPPVGP